MDVRILVHDYAGHPFQLDLSRELAQRGYQVTHAYFAGDAGPKGDLEPSSAANSSITIEAVDINSPYSKQSFLRRRFADKAYGRALQRLVSRIKPHLIISGNTPTEAQEYIRKICRRENIVCVHWLQDFYSIAATRILRQKLGLLGGLVGAYYTFLERRQLKDADEVVVITGDFLKKICAWGISRNKVTVIENWASLAHFGPVGKDNNWSNPKKLNRSFNFIYTGTLALKHNPELLIALADRMRGRAKIVAVCHGVGATILKRRQESDGTENLIVLPLQDFEFLPSILAASDVLVAMIEPDAGLYSVPSKVLSYLCADRPILLAALATNLAAKVVQREDAGLVVDPADMEGFLAASERLISAPDLRERLGFNGRAYAEHAFDVSRITSTFESVIRRSLTRNGSVDKLEGWRNCHDII